MASAMPQTSHLARGFSRWGKLGNNILGAHVADLWPRYLSSVLLYCTQSMGIKEGLVITRQYLVQ